MKITIFGTGYVGLVTGTCLAEVGHDVLCIDVDEKKIQDLKNGIVPIYEPGLTELVERNIQTQRLSFGTDAKKGIEFGDVVFSAVGTPPDKNHKADLKYVKQVAETFGKHTNRYQVFINKSTVPVGTGKMCREIIESRGKTNFDIASNPEFLREGTAVKDFMVPDRIVCGIESKKAKKMMEKVYDPFVRAYCKIIWTDIASAEIAKYAANSFLATKLSFINEIANFAEISGGNILDIVKAIGSDKRIGNKFLHAGIGYGGSCFPKDVNALIETGKEYGYDFQIIQSTEDVNEKQKLILVDKLIQEIPDLSGKIISIWGLSFKPKTDDIRDAPSIQIIESLLKKSVKEIKCYDPVSMGHVKELFKGRKNITFHTTSYQTLNNSNALMLITEWDEFRGVDFDRVKEHMSGNLIIDGRNIWDKTIENHGLKYISIGR